MMKKLVFAVAATLFSASAAFAQSPAPSSAAKAATPPAGSCESKAIDKNGKPLAGAAKASSIKKCTAGNNDGKAAACAAKAIDKNGKALGGAAKNSFMKKCEAAA
ncbi:MAG: hypothetical protein V4632_02995 [Pseudomonadota bacterium]